MAFFTRMPSPRSTLAAEGYLELGMAEEALAELDSDSEGEDSLESLSIRVQALMQLKRWAGAFQVCGTILKQDPAHPLGYIHGAYCLHELQRTAEAKQFLLSGPASLLSEPIYFYNLGCYNAMLGHTEEAIEALRVSFQMDEKYRVIAKEDPDLEALREQIL